MAVRDEYPGSVEGKIVDVNAMDIVPSLHPKKVQGISYCIFKLRDARAEIIRELEPKKFCILENSMLNLGDTVIGKRMEGMSRSFFKKDDVEVGGSGVDSQRHSRQHKTIKKFCFVEIVLGMRGEAAPEHRV